MNKKLIRLTESDLHRIVKEPVNKILTELDWKTYRNASRHPNSDRSFGGRQDKFTLAAKKAFNNKYGFESNTARFSCGYAMGNTIEPKLEINPYGRGRLWYPVRKEARGYFLIKGNQWNVNDNYTKINLSDFLTDEEIMKYENGIADWKHYIANNNDNVFTPSNDGDYEYSKEEGWNLKH